MRPCSTLNIAQRNAQRVVACLILCAVASPGFPGEPRKHVKIPEVPAPLSLSFLGVHFDRKLVFPFGWTRFVKTPAIECDCTITEALDRLLVGTHMLYEIDPVNVTVTIDQRYCWPELGEEAPLPPCLPR